MSGAASTAVGKFVGLTTPRSARFGLTQAMDGPTGTDTPSQGEVGSPARIDGTRLGAALETAGMA